MHWAMHHIAIISANRTESDFANELGYLSGANSSFSSSLLVGRQLGLKVFSSILLPERGLRPETRKHSRKSCKVAWSCRNLCHSSKDLEHPPRKLARKRHHLKKKDPAGTGWQAPRKRGKPDLQVFNPGCCQIRSNLAALA